MKSKQALLTAATIFLLMNDANAILVSVAGDTNAQAGGNMSPYDLRGALNFINMNPSTYDITFSLSPATITPLADLPVINLSASNTLTIDGGNNGSQITLMCSGTPGFFVRQGNVLIENMTIESGSATGGAGGTGSFAGGGGLGAGGALFIDQATVSVSNLTLTSNTATGGAGAVGTGTITLGGGGGGGMGGNGGIGNLVGADTGGGGGGGGLVGAGGNGSNNNGISAVGGGGGGGGGIGNGGNGNSPSDIGGGGGGGAGGTIGCNGGNQTSINGTGITGLGGGGGAGSGVSMGMGGSGFPSGNTGGAGSTNAGGGGGGGGVGGSIGGPASVNTGGIGGSGGTYGGGGGGGAATDTGGAGANTNGIGSGGGGGGFGGTGGAGGTASSTAYGGGGGGGGVAAASTAGGAGGAGAFGGGGGGGGGAIVSATAVGNGGNGGFGGAGGGGTTGGSSSFGAGGAGGVAPGTPGTGGGFESTSNSGGGAGLGGAIFINSGGTLLINGPLTTSGSNVTPGTGSPNNGGAAGTDIFARNGSTLTFTPGAGQTVTLTGSIADDSANSLPGTGGTYQAGSGSGASLLMNGAGELLLTGNQTHPYAGTTTIDAGTLFLNGTFSSSTNTVTVNTGGTFSGNTPTVTGNVSVADGATLAGGSATSQMVISGHITLFSNSTTSVIINPSSASVFNVGIDSEFAGNISVVVDPGSYPSSGSYTIINYQTPSSGSFNPTVLGGAPGFTFTRNDTGTGMIQLLYQFIGPPTSTTISLMGLSGNNLTLAKYLNKSNLTSQAYQDLTQLSGNALNKALSSVSPTRNADGIYAAEQTMFALSELLTMHFDEHRFFKSMNEGSSLYGMNRTENPSELLADASDDIAFLRYTSPCKPKPICCPVEKEDYDFWVGAFGEFAHQKAQHQSPAFNFTTEGILAAFDYYMNRGFVGGGLGYAHTHLRQDHHAGKASINYGIGTVYGGFDVRHFYMDVAFLGVYNHINNQRFISFPGFSATASAKINGWQFDPHVDLGYDIDYTWGCVEPFAAIDWANSWQRGYHEHGADSLNMSQGRHHSSLLRTEAGLKLYEDWEYDWGTFLLKEKVSYVYKKPYGTGSVTAAVVGGAGFFTVESLSSVQNLGAVGFEILARVGKSKPVSVGVAYAGEFGKQYQSNEVLLSVTKDF